MLYTILQDAWLSGRDVNCQTPIRAEGKKPVRKPRRLVPLEGEDGGVNLFHWRALDLVTLLSYMPKI